MNSARAAINAALEAARSASRGQSGGAKRPTAMSNQAAAAAAIAAPAPVSPAPPVAPAALAKPAPAPAPASTPPWDSEPSPQAAATQEIIEDDGPPSWATEFSDDSALVPQAVSVPASAPASAPAPARAPEAARPPYLITPVPAIEWDGNWPALAATLSLRGVAQQLAMQTELVDCVSDGHQSTFRLRAPIDTLRASGNTEKLLAVLQERFPATKVAVEVEIGPVWYTASVEAKAWREQVLQEAEQTVANHPFVQEMGRQFNAFVVQGSVRPPAAA
jgi:DNA polymerase-3 subunit gamma/tau